MTTKAAFSPHLIRQDQLRALKKDVIVADMIFDKYPTKDEGFLSRIKIKLVKGTNCTKLAKILDLSSYILRGSYKLIPKLKKK